MTDRKYDPELAPIIPLLPQLGMEDVAKARAGLEEILGSMARAEAPDDVTWDDRAIPGPTGAPDVTVRVYRPKKDGTGRPGVLYIHGGGFCVGSIESEHDGPLRICSNLGAVVVSVEYRLAPEHPFPAGFDDCYAALLWMAESYDALGIDPSRVAVMGGSAGGALAAAVALAARDRRGPRLCFQLLNIPVIDDRLDTPSMRQFTDTPMWNRPNAELSWKYYLGENPSEVSPYAAPGRATNLAGLPPAFVSTMEFDPLRDEGILYAMRLLEAGVSVELHQYPGTFHGSAVIPTAAVSQRSAAEMTAVLARALGAEK